MTVLVKVLLLLAIIASSRASLTIIRDLIQFNVAGHPILHKEYKFPIDPDIGARRARQYQELNGIHGEKAIELLGLGIDGFDRERLAQQRDRDEGHLGGVDHVREP